MKTVFLFIFISFVVSHSVGAAAAVNANVDRSGVALSGYDPVSYFEGQEPQKGDSKFQTKYNEATYWFASDAHLKTFLQEPKKYEPQFGGWCAFAVADSKSKVEIDPKSFLIQDGRLLLFYNGLWGNTRQKWQHTKGKGPQAFLKQADANWPEVQKKDP
jgi:YHS domain-containing protein